MEKLGDWERKNLINELIQGMEFAKQLRIHLNNSVSSSSHETREALTMGILASYEKALSMLSWRSLTGEPSSAVGAGALTTAPFRSSESPPSLGGGSPHSGDSDRDQDLWDASKKRKAVARWTKQVRVSPGVDIEGPLDDGYSWRKYGQKDILGAKFPRGYYRCSHRSVQGCLATKQVQRCDDDLTVFEITYRGRHTCNQSSRGMDLEPSAPENREQVQQTSQDVLLNFSRGLRVTTDELDSRNQPLFPPFNFPPPGNFAPASGISDLHGTTDQSDFRLSGSDHLAEIVLAATSRTNSTRAGQDSSYSSSGFNENNLFGSPGNFN